jgi:hydrogenase maturation protease
VLSVSEGLSPGDDRLLILGIGNRWRCDDGFGPMAADRLAALGFDAREHSGEGAGLMAAWEGFSRVIMIDASSGGGPPGTIRRLDASAETLPRGFFRYSSHLFGLAEAVETARALGTLPPGLVVYAVEGESFTFGEGLSPSVAAALDDVVTRVAAEAAKASSR